MFYIICLDFTYSIIPFFSVVLSAQRSGDTVTSFAVIPFKIVRISHGIHDLTSIWNEGKFTCEKPGLYLISVYVATNVNSNGYFFVYKNDQAIAEVYRHPQLFVITLTAIVSERLNINDTVYVSNGPEMYVFGAYDSTFSIVQIG